MIRGISDIKYFFLQCLDELCNVLPLVMAISMGDYKMRLDHLWGLELSMATKQDGSIPVVPNLGSSSALGLKLPEAFTTSCCWPGFLGDVVQEHLETKGSGTTALQISMCV